MFAPPPPEHGEDCLPQIRACAPAPCQSAACGTKGWHVGSCAPWQGLKRPIAGLGATTGRRLQVAVWPYGLLADSNGLSLWAFRRALFGEKLCVCASGARLVIRLGE